jgi:hypothetical protein
VVSRLGHLGAKGTTIIVLKAMTTTSFSSPGETKEQQPKENFASQRSSDFA